VGGGPYPARVADLEGAGQVMGELVVVGREPLGVEAQVGRQLEEERPELLAEGGGELAEALDELARVAEPELVGDALRGLEREAEAGRRLPGPAGEERRRREALEGVVDLHRTELPRVEPEHLARGEVLGVERPAPRGVAEARGADEHVRDARRGRAACALLGSRRRRGTRRR